MDDFFVELAENASSDGKESLWYFGVRTTCCSIVLQNLYLAKIKNYSPNYDINTKKYREVFIIFQRHKRKIVNFEISDQRVPSVNLNLSNEI